MTRKQARDLVFKIIYQAQIRNEAFSSLYEICKIESEIDEKSETYIQNALSGIEKNNSEINSIIEDKAKDWKINRISKISLSALILGIYEIIYDAEIPDTVAANEAVSLAKLYEGEESARFVNGILSSVINEKA